MVLLPFQGDVNAPSIPRAMPWAVGFLAFQAVFVANADNHFSYKVFAAIAQGERDLPSIPRAMPWAGSLMAFQAAYRVHADNQFSIFNSQFSIRTWSVSTPCQVRVNSVSPPTRYGPNTDSTRAMHGRKTGEVPRGGAGGFQIRVHLLAGMYPLALPVAVWSDEFDRALEEAAEGFAFQQAGGEQATEPPRCGVPGCCPRAPGRCPRPTRRRRTGPCLRGEWPTDGLRHRRRPHRHLRPHSPPVLAPDDVAAIECECSELLGVKIFVVLRMTTDKVASVYGAVGYVAEHQA